MLGRRYSSLRSSLLAGVVLTCCSVAAAVPWWLWATWAVLSLVSIAQAYRAHTEARGR